MKKKKVLDVRTLVEIAIFAALGYVLDLLAGAYSSFLPFINGGSIGIAMICVFVMSYRRGPLAGLLTGLIMAVLDLCDGYYGIASSWWKILLQVGLDYVIAYPLCAACGFFRGVISNAKNKAMRGLYISLGCILGGFLKFMSHFLSGILFWPESPTDKMNARVIYSITYNGGYTLPSVILSTIIMVVIMLLHPQLFLLEDISKEDAINE